MPQQKFKIQNQELLLLPERAIFWSEEKTIIVSDLHFGKAAHFRKSGIAISDEIFFNDMIHLDKIMHQYDAQQLLVVGDMFHSSFNNEVNFFKLWQEHTNHFDVVLVKGNHDIMNDEIYDHLNIEVRNSKLEIGNLVFVHEPIADNEIEKDKFYFFGHVHPKAVMKGAGNQHLSLPCFYFTPNTCTLPAFSQFSGGFKIKPKKGDCVFVIAGKEVIKI
ncbi:MAG: ligase-associated DNA damage response endonuclease PdeM [Bacteroidia bacterium]